MTAAGEEGGTAENVTPRASVILRKRLLEGGFLVKKAHGLSAHLSREEKTYDQRRKISVRSERHLKKNLRELKTKIQGDQRRDSNGQCAEGVRAA